MSNPLTDKFEQYVIDRYLSEATGEPEMAKRGRPASSQPQTAYDYRRVIALCQVLAIEDLNYRDENIHMLVDNWLPQVKHRGNNRLPIDYLLKLLAQHALEQAQGEGDNDGT